jgi:hypothetical protein
MLYTLWALFAPLWRDSRSGASSHRGAAGAFASPLLVFVVAVLFSFLSILVVDLHLDELQALGLAGATEQINPVFISP